MDLARIRVLRTLINSIAKNLHKLQICLRFYSFYKKLDIQAIIIKFDISEVFNGCCRFCRGGSKHPVCFLHGVFVRWRWHPCHLFACGALTSLQNLVFLGRIKFLVKIKKVQKKLNLFGCCRFCRYGRKHPVCFLYGVFVR